MSYTFNNSKGTFENIMLQMLEGAYMAVFDNCCRVTRRYRNIYQKDVDCDIQTPVHCWVLLPDTKLRCVFLSAHL